MTATVSRPLITFAIIGYKQERFIAEAIAGALAQTHSPLEIILSDDCSPDATFAIMQRMAAEYRGPHQIVLNRNAKNSGIVGHVNRVAELASSELIVIAAGDDISLPERTTISAEAWEKSGRRATSIHGRFVMIDHEGRETGEEKKITWPSPTAPVSRQLVTPLEFVRVLQPSVQGSCHAFAKRLFTELGPLPAYLTYEDIALAFRSVLAGEIYYVDQVLVRYRRHGENSYAPLDGDVIANREQLRAYHQQVARENGRYARLYDGFSADVDHFRLAGKLTDAEASSLQAEIARVRHPYRLKSTLVESSLGRRLRAAWELLQRGGNGKFVVERLLPRVLYEGIYFSKRRLSRSRSAAQPQNS